jgi:[ribosomal protein S5]-alanine N-acetyltransferase
MQTHYTTPRLSLNELSPGDHLFIKELVNRPEWIKFIGERNVRTEEDAKTYVQKIMDNPNVHYWVVRLKEDRTAIGIITFIKRDYLEHHDIGFAFLSEHGKKGYAYEATAIVLKDIVRDPAHSYILATTVKENISSIKLLERLGLRQDKEVETGNTLLLVYSAPSDTLFPGK